MCSIAAKTETVKVIDPPVRSVECFRLAQAALTPAEPPEETSAQKEKA
jgi:hypothetical protein